MSENPYRTPNPEEPAPQVYYNPSAAVPSEQPQWEPLPEEHWPNLDLQIHNVTGRWSRSLQISGSINVNLRYEAWGAGERLYLDGYHILTTDQFTMKTVYPVLDFNLYLDHFYVPARIDVAASFLKLLMISRFKLTVANRVIYEE